MASTTTTPRWRYDVFLSFRGEDTRNSFISHLYSALKQKGIITFKDDLELERGNTISKEIVKAIENSRFSLVIFSPNYASSSWCLDELLTIYDCKMLKGHTAFPVFYHVNPSEVAEQTGKFGDYFAEHEKVFMHDELKKVERWKTAMSELTNISGWDLGIRDESRFIDDIVKDILRKLRKSSYFSNVEDDFVGMDTRLNNMISYLNISNRKDVRMIGIRGMGGIGKTTISRVVYESLFHEFEGSCFVEKIREKYEKKGLHCLQEELLHETLMDKGIKIVDIYRGMDEIRKRLRSRRVLIVLDDVDEAEQLKSLVGLHSWFGSGSRIIITTRNEHLLICHGVDEIYEIETLDDDEALQLFRSKAFKNCCPSEDYLQLCNVFIKYANGLPLALDVLGSFLCGRSIDKWRSALNRLQEIPHKKILDKLQISFDGLEKVEKQIFLDIACFFNGEHINLVKKILDTCGLHPEIGITILIEKSLLKITDHTINMHHLLQEMGREIVRSESHEEPGKRSRLWLFKDVNHVLLNNTGSEQIQGIFLQAFAKEGRHDFDVREKEEQYFSAESFLKMNKLRLLRLRDLLLSSEVGLEHLCSELRYIEWPHYSLKYLPPFFKFDKLVELHLQHSNIKQCWKKTRSLKSLKVLNLSHSCSLIKITGFEGFPNLEELNLEGCLQMVKIHQSIGVLQKLVRMNLKNCQKLMNLPSSLCELISLKFLALDGCSKLNELPEKFQDLCLEELSVSGIIGKQMPSKPWQCLLRLRRKNPNLMTLFLCSFSALSFLKELDLSDCNLTEWQIPKDLSSFPSLQALNLSGNYFVSLPPSICRLSKLEKLCVASCKKLREMSDLPSSITCLRMDGCTSLETLPNPIQKNTLSPLMMTFVSCRSLNKIKGVVEWLKSYFRFLLISRQQGLFSVECDFSMCLPGTRVPSWFNYQETGSSLVVQLPKDWCNDNCLGFFACAVLGVLDPSIDQRSGGYSIELELIAGSPPDQFLYQDNTKTDIVEGIKIKTNQLWLIFLPRDQSKSLDWWNLCTHFIAEFSGDGLEVKHCGFSLVYEQDIESLVNNRPSKMFGVHHDQLDHHLFLDHSVKEIGDASCSGDSMMLCNDDALDSPQIKMPMDPYLRMITKVRSIKGRSPTRKL